MVAGITSESALCLTYLQHAFPTRAMESYFDDEGNERSRPRIGDDGNPVHCPEAIRIRDDTIELLAALPPIASALDAIITRFGVDAVAEVTGRSKRLLTLPDGSQKLQSRSASSGIADANLFMAGKKRVLVFSDAGGTGRSYHASLAAPNQQRRVHFLLEPGWRADKAILGARAHQPYTSGLSTDLPASHDRLSGGTAVHLDDRAPARCAGCAYAWATPDRGAEFVQPRRQSGRCGPLLGRTPLRTGHAAFTASGSSLFQARYDPDRQFLRSSQGEMDRDDLNVGPEE